MAIYSGIGNKIYEMQKNESFELANFLEPNRRQLGTLLSEIYGACDSFELEFEPMKSDENEF